MGRQEPLSEWQIKSIHRLILKGIQDEHAGAYRKQNVLTSGATHIPPDMAQVPIQMEQLIKWYEGEGKQLHPVERAARVHSDFAKIHPFIDGNGRTARLLLNFELMKNGYPPIVIEKESGLSIIRLWMKPIRLGILPSLPSLWLRSWIRLLTCI